MLRRAASLIRSGVRLIVLLALSDDGAPALRPRARRRTWPRSARPSSPARRTSSRTCWPPRSRAATSGPGRPSRASRWRRIAATAPVNAEPPSGGPQPRRTRGGKGGLDLSSGSIVEHASRPAAAAALGSQRGAARVEDDDDPQRRLQAPRARAHGPHGRVLRRGPGAAAAARTLHVTNGDTTVAGLAALGIEALPWRDALHEGPVAGPAASCARRRCAARRTSRLATACSTATTATSSCGSRPTSTTSCSSPRSSRGSAWRRRHAAPVGEPSASRTSAASASSRPSSCEAFPTIALTAEALALGARAWEALIAPDPSGLLTIADRTSCGSWPRPSPARAGVPVDPRRPALTERRLLAGRPGTKFELFCACLAQGGATVHGRHVGVRAAGPARAAARRRRRRPAPQRARRARASPARRRSSLDRWIGGVHVTPARPWRWDDARETLVQRR